MGGDPSRVVVRRVIAYLLDAVVSLLAFWLVVTSLGVDVESDPTAPGGFRYDGSTTSVALAGLVPVGYWLATGVLAQGLLGWTPGKLLVGIRLVGWDGRAPGLWRAFVHTLVVQVFMAFSCLGGLLLVSFATFNRFHRHPGDMLANTYVVDAWSMDHMMLRTAEGLRAGPPAVTRQDVVREYGAEAAAVLAPVVTGKPTEPTYDKQRDTYVVWNPKRQAWLQFDKASGQWVPLR